MYLIDIYFKQNKIFVKKLIHTYLLLRLKPLQCLCTYKIKYLEELTSMGKKKFTTTLDSDMIKQLKIIAVEEDTSVASLLENLVQSYLLAKTS